MKLVNAVIKSGRTGARTPWTRCRRRTPPLSELTEERHQHDAVLHGDPQEHDERDRGRDRGAACRTQRWPSRHDEGERQVEQHQSELDNDLSAR